MLMEDGVPGQQPKRPLAGLHRGGLCLLRGRNCPAVCEAPGPGSPAYPAPHTASASAAIKPSAKVFTIARRRSTLAGGRFSCAAAAHGRLSGEVIVLIVPFVT
jgi:hypothetical protein